MSKQDSNSKYVSGFCSNGHCEGTAPVSPSGKHMKVCVKYELCACACHQKFNRMYEMAGEPRRVHQNPNYVPFVGPDLSMYFGRDMPGASLAGGQTSRGAEKRSETAPGLLESARTFTETPSGYRQRGQLETEVQQICNRAMLGEFDEPCTPQFIANLIDPDSPPSTGAIGAVFARWERLGYAKINHKPLYFKGLTLEGMRDGLEALKRKTKR